jgi:predicted nucleic acid-binding protein
LSVLLVDASAWVALVDATSPYRESTASMIQKQARSLAVLDLTLYEIANAVGVKQGNPVEAGRILRLVDVSCRERVLAVDRDLLDSALQVAAKHGLTAYDAPYVAAAQRHGWTLVSTDIRDLVSKGLAVTPDAADYP